MKMAIIRMAMIEMVIIGKDIMKRVMTNMATIKMAMMR